MNHTSQHATNLKLLSSENRQNLPRRLVILLGLAWPMTTFIIVSGVAYIFLPLRWEIWLLMGGGIFFGGGLSAWVTTRSLRRILQHTSRLKETNKQLQQELNVRKEADETLKESEARYRQVVEFSPDGIIIIHRENQIAFINAAGTKLLGATGPDQPIGRPITDFVRPDDRAFIDKWIQQAKSGQTVAPIERKLIQYNQKEIEVEITGIPFSYQNKPAAQLAVRNITNRKKEETKITRRNRQLTILQSAGVAITSRLDLRYVLDTVAREMTRLVEVDGCAIFEWNRPENRIAQIARYSPQGWWDPKSTAQVYDLVRYPLTKSVLEEQVPEQMTSGQPDVDPSELAYMKAADVKTLLIVPMIFQRRVLGVVKLEAENSAEIEVASGAKR